MKTDFEKGNIMVAVLDLAFFVVFLILGACALLDDQFFFKLAEFINNIFNQGL